MYYHIVFALLFSTALSVYSSPISTTKEGAIERARLATIDIVGQVGNKVFFRSSETELVNGTNWFEAEGRCLAAGLQFAKFDNRVEFAFIQSHYPTHDYSFWVGAQLRHQQNDPRANALFQWTDGTDGFDLNLHYSPSMWTCLYFDSDVLYPGLCRDDLHHFLCQLVLP